MSTMKLYMLYKMHCLKAYLREQRNAVSHIQTWWRIWSGLFVAFVVVGVLTQDIRWWYYVLATFIGLIMLSFYKDYTRGSHMHWHRVKRGYSLAKNGKQVDEKKKEGVWDERC